jgi:thioredoxin-dependent peroxiredoxin
MAQIRRLRGNPITTVGDVPAVGSPAPEFPLTGPDLAVVSGAQFRGRPLLFIIFPLVDTPECATSVRSFNECAQASGLSVLCVSKDLPFTQKRFCGAEAIGNVTTAPAFRGSFGDDFGVTIVDGPMAGILARAVVVIGADGDAAYTELVPAIDAEPSNDAGLDALGPSVSAAHGIEVIQSRCLAILEAASMTSLIADATRAETITISGHGGDQIEAYCSVPLERPSPSPTTRSTASPTACGY